MTGPVRRVLRRWRSAITGRFVTARTARRDIPEPWMFGTIVTVDGREVRGQVGRFTLLGRMRIAVRRLTGKPWHRGTPYPSTED
jgi:hypothetical protein